MSNADWVRVIVAYEGGASLRALAKKWKRSPKTIKAHLEGDAVDLRPPAKYAPLAPLTEQDRQYAIDIARHDRQFAAVFAIGLRNQAAVEAREARRHKERCAC